METFLNKKDRRKNYFQIFINQISPKIEKQKDRYMNNNNILLSVKGRCQKHPYVRYIVFNKKRPLIIF